MLAPRAISVYTNWQRQRTCQDRKNAISANAVRQHLVSSVSAAAVVIDGVWRVR